MAFISQWLSIFFTLFMVVQGSRGSKSGYDPASSQWRLPRTLHLSPQNEEQKMGYKTRIVEAEALNFRAEFEMLQSRSVRSADNGVDPQNRTTRYNLGDSHNNLIIHWAGEGSDVIFALAKNPDGGSSALFISQDYGKTFANVSSLLMVNSSTQAIIDQYYAAEYLNNHYVLTDIIHKCVFTTITSGRIFSSSCNLPFRPRTLKLNPVDPYKMLAMDEESSDKQLYLSEDFGQSWRAVMSNVKSFHWGRTPYDNASTIYVEEEVSSGKSQIVRSDSMFENRYSSTVLLTDVIEFEMKDEYMFATKSVILLGSHFNPNLQLWVSYNRQPFVKAEFPGNHNFTDYYVADASENQLMVCVTLNGSVTHLYISDVKGFRFSLSLERIVYINPDKNPRYSIKEAFADITKIHGVRGIYIATQHSPTSERDQVSLITFDKGGRWDKIKAPEFVDGDRPSNCRMTKDWVPPRQNKADNCSLHLTQKYQNSVSGQPAPPILTQGSSPGIVLASGTMGQRLSGDPDVFLSANAGIDWRQVLSGIYLYATADHGGIIVAVLQSISTDEVVYSIDEGETWHRYKFVDGHIRVYGLLTEPGENTTIFSVFGSGILYHSWVIIQIDFKDVFEGKKCGDDDYKMWSVEEDLPKDDGCLLGRVTQYQRRVAHAVCYNGDDFVRRVEVTNCTCTQEDFECDYGFEDNGFGICQRDQSVTNGDLHPIPNPCPPGTFYDYSRGYRKVAGDTCRGGQEHRFAPLRYSCPIQERNEFLLLTELNQVGMVDLASGEKTTLFYGMGSHVPAVFDYQNNCVIYVDSGSMRTQCFSDTSTRVVDRDILRPASSGSNVDYIAFDWTGRNIYFADSNNSTISIINVDGRFERQLYTSAQGFFHPKTLLVDPHHGYLFFVAATSASGSDYRIYRAVMDGSDSPVAAVTNSSVVDSETVLTLDLDTEKLYWVSPSRQSVFSSDIRGASVTMLYHGLSYFAAASGIGIYKNNLYVSTKWEGSVYTANKNAPTNWQYFTEVNKAYGMVVVSSTSQHASSACSAYHAQCTQLCLPRPTPGSDSQNRTCLCGDGYRRSTTSGSNDETCMCEQGEMLHDNGTCVKAQNSTSCAADKLTCRNGNCVRATWKCDGDDDCGDGTDEMDCLYQTCSVGHFTCFSGKCIPQAWVCDREDDCKDGRASDELNCRNQSCSSEQFQCDNGYCINKNWVCDMDDDCHDGSDERNCGNSNSTCPQWQFTCKSGECINQAYKCNGERDCSDGSDELNCTTRLNNCSAWQFDCGDGQCIFSLWKCDGEADCSNGNDEKNCTISTTIAPTPGPCSFGYRCNNGGGCVEWTEMCNGVNDCADGSDEWGCWSTSRPTTTTPPSTHCPHWEFSCRFDHRCLAMSKRCDGHVDCWDGSDEANCEVTCPSDHYQCRSNSTRSGQDLCIWNSWVCDGSPDCPDGDDETDCDGGEHCQGPSWVSCVKGGGCIHTSQLCDMVVDCGDASDEKGCNYTKPVNCSNFNNHKDLCCSLPGCGVYIPAGAGPTTPSTTPRWWYWDYDYEDNDYPDTGDLCLPLNDHRHANSTCDHSCKAGQFSCHDAGPFCISFVQVCDGQPDCRNSRDEQAGCTENGCELPSYIDLYGVSDPVVQNTSFTWTFPARFRMVSYAESVPGHSKADLYWRNVTASNSTTHESVQIRNVTVIDLKPMTEYLVVLFKPSASGRMCFDRQLTIITHEGLPSAPLQVTARVHVEFSASAVDLMWRVPDSPNGMIRYYVIYHQQVEDGKTVSDVFSNKIRAEAVANANKLDFKYIVTDFIENNKTYQFWVAAITGAGEGTPSNKTIPLRVVPVAETDLKVKVVNITESTFIVTWVQDSKATGYQVKVQFHDPDSIAAARLDDLVKTVDKSQTSITIGGMCPQSSVQVGVQATYDNHVVGLVYRPSNGGFIQLAGTQPRIHIHTINKTEPTSFLLGYDLQAGTAKQYYIYYTYDENVKPKNHTAEENYHKLVGLLACERYFVWVRPAFPTCPYSEMENFVTTEDEKAPPKNLKADVKLRENDYLFSLNLTWSASCYQVSIPVQYVISVKKGDDAAHDILTAKPTANLQLSQFFPEVTDGVKYTFTVRTYIGGSQESSPLTVDIPSLDGPYNIVVKNIGGQKVSVRWQWPQAKDETSEFLEFVVVTKSKDVTLTNHTSKFEIQLQLPAEGLYTFTVSAMSKSGKQIAVSKPEYTPVEFQAPNNHDDSNISISKTNLVAILVPVAVVVVALSAGLVVFIVRHKRLQRSFLAFANSHYNIQSGTTTFSDDLDGDEPMIQGFSDDEPLVIA